jgi:hypothetical protein
MLAAGLVVSACSRPPAPEAAKPAPEAAAPAAAPETAAAPDAQADALVAKEAELASREQELALKEREADLARREAELAAKQNAAKPTAAAKPAAAAPAKKPEATAATAAKPKPVPLGPITIPAGTQFSVELTAPLSTKTAHKHDRVDGRLAADIVIDGRKAASAGAAVDGTVTEVVSGSQKIGGTPLLGISFDKLTVADGSTVAIAGTLAQKGKKVTTRRARSSAPSWAARPVRRLPRTPVVKSSCRWAP